MYFDDDESRADRRAGCIDNDVSMLIDGWGVCCDVSRADGRGGGYYRDASFAIHPHNDNTYHVA